MRFLAALTIVLVALAGQGAAAAITWIQLAEVSLAGGTSYSTNTFGAPTTTGNSIICSVQYQDASGTTSVLSVTDTAGDTFSPAGSHQFFSAEGYSDEIWYAGGITGGVSVNMTITLSASATVANASCHEFGGIKVLLDQQAGANSVGTATSLTAGPVTTTAAGELVFAAGFTGSSLSSPGSGFTQVSGQNNDIVEYKISGAAGPVTASTTSSVSDNMTLKMATFIPWTGCLSPTGATGEIGWNSSTGTVRFCNGTSWIDTTWSTGASCSGTPAGTMRYNSGSYQYCNGTNWMGMKGPSNGSCSGTPAGTMTYTSNTYRFCDGTTWYKMGALSCQFILTSSTSWTVPADFNNNYNLISLIGGGGGGAGSTTTAGGGGGGGGAYSGLVNATLPASVAVKYSIGVSGGGGGAGGAGSGGGPTYFCNSSSNCTSAGDTAVIASAAAGNASTGTAAGAGGLKTSSVGTFKNSGGNGSANVATTKGGGGGGAAGPNGDGLAAAGVVGGTGDNGFGGSGGPVNGVGFQGAEWSATAGAGGGAGGSNTAAGKAAGNYGAGGGGGGTSGTARAGGAGRAGIIVIKYNGSNCF